MNCRHCNAYLRKQQLTQPEVYAQRASYGRVRVESDRIIVFEEKQSSSGSGLINEGRFVP